MCYRITHEHLSWAIKFYESYSCVSRKKSHRGIQNRREDDAMNSLRISPSLVNFRWSKYMLCNSTRNSLRESDSCSSRLTFTVKNSIRHARQIYLNDDSSCVCVFFFRDNFYSYNRKKWKFFRRNLGRIIWVKSNSSGRYQ